MLWYQMHKMGFPHLKQLVLMNYHHHHHRQRKKTWRLVLQKDQASARAKEFATTNDKTSAAKPIPPSGSGLGLGNSNETQNRLRLRLGGGGGEKKQRPKL
jgi:hypothetical protein